MAMYDSLYPHYGVAKLREQHGCRWGDIIDEVHALHVTDPRVMAFTLTIKKIRKQHQLSASLCKDPFCAVCTAEILEHFGGSEEDLINFYFANLREIQQTLKLMYNHRVERVTQMARTA
jgi:hypothetical protein